MMLKSLLNNIKVEVDSSSENKSPSSSHSDERSPTYSSSLKGMMNDLADSASDTILDSSHPFGPSFPREIPGNPRKSSLSSLSNHNEENILPFPGLYPHPPYVFGQGHYHHPGRLEASSSGQVMSSHPFLPSVPPGVIPNFLLFS